MKNNCFPSIVDVAKVAALSPATVSRVLNKTGYISDETKNTVEIAARELEYFPNI